MSKGKLILITGGARSGKSVFAERLTEGLSVAGERVIYLATAGVEDEEMKRRVFRHQQRRPAHWETVEEPLLAEKVIREFGDGAGVILLDCLSLLLTNWLFQPGAVDMDDRTLWDDQERLDKINEAVMERVRTLFETVSEAKSHVITVTNEVGLGLVPDNPLGRFYRDLLGLANQTAAARADEVYVVWSGIPVKIKG